MLNKYYVSWEIGVHHITVETTKEDFERVMEDLKEEFPILRSHLDGETTDGKEFEVTQYHIRNYWDEMQTVGYIVSEKE